MSEDYSFSNDYGNDFDDFKAASAESTKMEGGVRISWILINFTAVVLFIIAVQAIYLLYKRLKKKYGARSSSAGSKLLPIHQCKSTTAVKSVGFTAPYLKKTPSPTATAPLVSAGTNGDSQKTEKGLTNEKTGGAVVDSQSAENANPPAESEESTSSVAKYSGIETASCVDEQGIGELGRLYFGIRYMREKELLVVSVLKCQNLPVKSSNVSGDPYVKLQLLPEKQHKAKTRVLRKTRNPIYDEDFSFYDVKSHQLRNSVLHFIVLTFDRYSRDEIIGEVLFPLASVDFSLENVSTVYQENIQPRSLKVKAQGRGELLVSLCWQPAANRLTVVILKARSLPKMDVAGLADPYVKIYLMYKGQRIAKKKTHVKKRTLNPVFNESFIFEVPADSEDLQAVSLEFLLLDWDRMTKNEVIGRLEIGSSSEDGTPMKNHWNEVCNSPRRQIADWHKLYA